MNRKYSSNPSAAIVLSKDVDFGTTAGTKDLNIYSEYLLDDAHVHIKRETRESNLDLYDEDTGAADAAQAEISKSLYVIKLSEMIRTVLDQEAHLFTASEIKILHTILRLEYHPQFLISRIALRKRGKWHRFDHLLSRYTQEFVKYMKVPEHDVSRIMADVLSKLCPQPHAEERTSVSVDQRVVIDLTLDSDDDEPTGNPESTVAPIPAGPSDSTLDDVSELLSLVEDSGSATPTELLECLITDELKAVAKKLKIPGKTKSIRTELIKAILRSTSTQTTLPFAVVSKSSAASPQKPKNDWKRYFPFKPREISGKKQNMPLQERRIREMCNEAYGACFRLRDEVFQVLHLVSVVYFRTTEYSESDSIMLSAILANTGKRNYPKYEYKRTTDVFETRTDVLQYMKTSELLNQVDSIQEGVGQPSGEKFDRLEAAQEVIKIWKGQCDRWNSLVTYLKDKSRRQRGLERFEEGYLLTRLAYKAADCFGRLKKFDMELKLLGALLRQTRWRRSKRGRWYDRMALIYHRHMGGGDANLYKARDTLLEGLKDDLVHIGSRPMMLRRLQKLEKQLRISQEEQYVGEGDLRTAVQIQIEGARVFTPPNLAASSKHTGTTPVPASTIETTHAVHSNYPSISSTAVADKQQRPKWMGKSIWVGKEGNVNVETFALEYYATLGFRGFHSEGTIVSTLFGLLFWDILFAPVPGAFETPYQSAPLDLAHDSFFTSREDIIYARLDELTNDPEAARRIIEDVDSREREKETWCVGVRWDLFERDDLLEIVDCLGGRALATICRLLAEEYGNRGGGVPDLFVWNASEKICKFVEVKGPGDNLSETQKVWIDVLLGAGVDVEVCRVYEHGKIPTPRSAKGKKNPKIEPRRRSTSKGQTPKAARRNLEAADEDQASDQETEEEEDELWSSSEDGTGLEDGTTRPKATRPPEHPQNPSKHLPPGITPLQPEEPDPRTRGPAPLPEKSATKRNALDATLDAVGRATKRSKTEAVTKSSPAAKQVPPSPNIPTLMNSAHTTLLRPITSLPAPVLPGEPTISELSHPGSAAKVTESGQAPTQGTIIPETPQPTQTQLLIGCSSLVLDAIPKPSTVVESPELESHAKDRSRSNAKSNPQLNPSPKKGHILTNKQLRDMLMATPTKKSRKGKFPELSPVKHSPPREPTPTRKRKDPSAHTPPPKSISTSPATTTPKTRAPDPNDDSAGTTRTLRKRPSKTSTRTGLAGSPKEWEKKWPDVFPQWVGELGGSSDPDYEPSQ